MTKNGKFTSIFQLIDQKKFGELVKKWDVDKGIRSFSTWEMTCALLTSSALRLSSLREVEDSLLISKSTLSDALKRRCHGFFFELCEVIVGELQKLKLSRKAKKGLREILAIDATEVFVHGSLFRHKVWTRAKKQGNKASCKLHAVYSVDGDWVDSFAITGGKRGDSPVSHYLPLESEKIYVFDRAYNDLKFWLKILDQGSHFVTRLRDSKKHVEMTQDALSKSNGAYGVLLDTEYVPSIPQQYRCMHELKNRRFRIIVYRCKETDKLFRFITSDFNLDAKTIAAIYKRRWAIELLFRWLKGHLNIRYLPLRTTNGAKTQLAIAILLRLLLQFQKMQTKSQNTIWELLRSSRAALIRKSLSGSGFDDTCRWNRLHRLAEPIRESWI